MDLRPYQIECLEAIQSKAKEGLSRQMVVLPTGAGKTVVFSELIKRKSLKTLVIAHRIELLEQAFDKLIKVAPDVDVGIFSGNQKCHGKQVTIASIQSASNALDLLKAEGYQLLIIDEAHHAAAKTYQRLIKHLGFHPELSRPNKEAAPEVWASAKPYLDILGVSHLKASPTKVKGAYRQLAIKYHPDKNGGSLECAETFKKIQGAYEFLIKRDHMLLKEEQVQQLEEEDPSRPVVVDNTKLMVGFTATPKRGDRVGLNDIFQDIVFSMSIKKLVHRGFLVKPEGLHVKVGIDLKGVRTQMGDFKKASLRKVMLSDQARGIVIETMKRFASDRRGIVFSVDIEHSELLKEDIQASGFSCDVVHSKVSPIDRKQRLEDFASGKLQFIVNPMLLTEGFDCPRADCMINAAPTKNKSLYIQKAGRVLRTYPDKENALLIDFGTTKKKHKLATAIDLMGEKIAMRTVSDYNDLYPSTKKERDLNIDLAATQEAYDPLGKSKITPISDHADWFTDPRSSFSWASDSRPATPKQKELIKKLSRSTGIRVDNMNKMGIGQVKRIIEYLIEKNKNLQMATPITAKQEWYLKKLIREQHVRGLGDEKIHELSKYEARSIIGRLQAKAQ